MFAEVDQGITRDARSPYVLIARGLSFQELIKPSLACTLETSR